MGKLSENNFKWIILKIEVVLKSNFLHQIVATPENI